MILVRIIGFCIPAVFGIGGVYLFKYNSSDNDDVQYSDDAKLGRFLGIMFMGLAISAVIFAIFPGIIQY